MRFPLACVIVLFAATSIHAGVPGCPGPTPFNTFILYAGPASNCTPSSGPCAAAEPIAFTVGTFGFNLSCAVHTFTWNFGDGGTSTSLSPTHAYASPGTYTVTMTITDPNGSVTVTTLVKVAAPVPATSTPMLLLLAFALAATGIARAARG
jgi:hypothetical protein